MNSGRLCASAILGLFLALFVASCDSFTNPCRRVSKAPSGPSKEQYLPCATAMLDRLGKVDAGLVKLANGDKTGRGEALHAMTDFERDARLLGGITRLQQKWNDPDLNEINSHMYSAYRVYKIETTGLVVQIFYHLKTDDVSLHNVEVARREADQARNSYRLGTRRTPSVPAKASP